MKEIRPRISFSKYFLFKFIYMFFACLIFKSYAQLPSSLTKDFLPTLKSGPPSSIYASYDLEIPLKVTLSENLTSKNSTISWILNSKKICTGTSCEILLKEKDYKELTPILFIIATNSYGGTTYSYEFKMHTRQGFESDKWNKEVAYLKRDAIPKSAQNPPNYSSQNAVALFGKGTLIQNDYMLYIGKVSRSFVWKQGYFQTDNLDSLRITDSESGVWFLLPSTRLTLQDQSDDVNARVVELNFGNIRTKASGNLYDTDEKTKDFKNKMIILTDETQLNIPRGGDALITRETDKKGEFFTRVIAIGGAIEILPNLNSVNEQEKEKYKNITLGSGMELIIYGKGKLLPVTSPKRETIDNFLAFTTTADELQARKLSANILNLDEVLEKAAILAENEEYFELLNLLAPYQAEFNKNALLPYYYGFAKKGLFQTYEAKKYFLMSQKLDNNFPLSHWQLGLIYLDEKKYSEALNELLIARKNMKTEEKYIHEYEYYVGVAYYFKNMLQEAKRAFKRAVWDNDLDAALRQSAAEFLKKINIDKPWSLIVPVGIQYDGNILSIAQNQSLPSQYSTKAGWRSVIGGLYNYDTSKESDNAGWFLGGGGKAFYVKNFTSDYTSLDTIILEGSVFETNRNYLEVNGKKEKQGYRLYQTAGTIIVNNAFDTQYLIFGINYKELELNMGIQIDISDRSTLNQKSGLIYNQYYTYSFGNYGVFSWDISLQGQEQIMFNTTSAVGHSLEAIATPSATYALDSKTSFKLSTTFDFLYTFLNPLQSNYKFIPTASANYFFLDWLIGTFNLTYEYDIVFPGPSTVNRPGFALLFTGIF
ncbi:tetratricopeptide repeat protein [Fluviispira multicolorata]|uniref:Tetratricopeptide repeat protein n=1 Tax=Fluviispira multicolorata TaxID=2654512 RepID=A0A833N5D4_9BACT|nr:tetratricopeptide repeat protein [Fluviispira multicolorata]KAB8027401.1 hypothetical protein GCL57_14490 [Fluviispira multicolorata]